MGFGFGVLGFEFWVWGLRFQGAGFTERRVLSESQIVGLDIGVWEMEFRVLGLGVSGLGVWDLEFGIENEGFTERRVLSESERVCSLSISNTTCGTCEIRNMYYAPPVLYVYRQTCIVYSLYYMDKDKHASYAALTFIASHVQRIHGKYVLLLVHRLCVKPTQNRVSPSNPPPPPRITTGP